MKGFVAKQAKQKTDWVSRKGLPSLSFDLRSICKKINYLFVQERKFAVEPQMKKGHHIAGAALPMASSNNSCAFIVVSHLFRRVISYTLSSQTRVPPAESSVPLIFS